MHGRHSIVETWKNEQSLGKGHFCEQKEKFASLAVSASSPIQNVLSYIEKSRQLSGLRWRCLKKRVIARAGSARSEP